MKGSLKRKLRRLTAWMLAVTIFMAQGAVPSFGQEILPVLAAGAENLTVKAGNEKAETETPAVETGNPEAGVGNPEAGAGNPKAGVGNPEAGVGNPEAGAGNLEAGAGNPAMETGNLAVETEGPAAESGPQIGAPSALLMEASTGKVIYEKNADEPRNPASVTKIMTLILIFDAIQSGKIKLSDEVVTSAHAKSMGGSQVFLEEGEVQTVETLIKCIVIASGNDASVAMAEYIGGDEGTFVKMMNERAAGLGMENTKFIDCCGLTDSLEHVTTARDIALMSRELITKYPQIFNYSTIWMENITHVTKQGTKEFGLSNTNKLLKMATNFEVTGLKTGSASIAKYCLSATARKDGVELIAAIMAAPDFKTRFNDAAVLLNYGYANCKLYKDEDMPVIPAVPVKNGISDTVKAEYQGTFSYLSLSGEDLGAIEKEMVLEEEIVAPVKKGDILGYLVYRLNGEELGRVAVISSEDIREAKFTDYLKRLWKAVKL